MSQEILIVLGPFMAAVIGVSLWGWGVVPADARFRGRLGITGTDFTVGKGTSLALRLLVGIVVYLGAAMAGARGWTFTQAALLGAISLVVILIGQVSAIRRAR